MTTQAGILMLVFGRFTLLLMRRGQDDQGQMHAQHAHHKPVDSEAGTLPPGRVYAA